MRRRPFLALLPLATAFPARAQQAQPVTVFAAASLTELMRDLGRQWAARGNPEPRFVFAASSALARQIEQGAAADIFVSADERWMTYAQERNLVLPETRIAPRGNALALISRADRPGEVRLARDVPILSFLSPGERIITGEAHTPFGQYTQQALTWLGQWNEVRPRLAFANTVREAATLVERGEAPFASIFTTDVFGRPALKVAATYPPESHDPILYPFALTPRAAQNAQARALLAFLTGAESEAEWRRHGFTILR